jgi:hypothetical protein
MLASSERNDNVSVTGVADSVHRIERDGFAVEPPNAVVFKNPAQI